MDEFKVGWFNGIAGKVWIGVVRGNMQCDHQFDLFLDLFMMSCPMLAELGVAKTGEFG